MTWASAAMLGASACQAGDADGGRQQHGQQRAADERRQNPFAAAVFIEMNGPLAVSITPKINSTSVPPT